MSSSIIKTICSLAVLAATLSAGSICAATADSTLAPVAKMYRTFAWEALSNESDLFGSGLAEQSAAALSQYFDVKLAKMIADDAACQRRTQAFCKLDFDILFASQDPRIVDLSIAAGAANTVNVKFKDPVTDKETLIAYTVVRGTGGWRISDVAYENAGGKSLRTMLSEPSKHGVKENPKRKTH